MSTPSELDYKSMLLVLLELEPDADDAAIQAAYDEETQEATEETPEVPESEKDALAPAAGATPAPNSAPTKAAPSKYKGAAMRILTKPVKK